MVRVAVAGALGRMGGIARTALQGGELDGVVFAGGLARARAEDDAIVDDLGELIARFKPDVLLDFTVHPASVRIATAALEAGVRPVVGATGWSEGERASFARLVERRASGAMLVPNFSIGAVLMMRFAREAARFFPSAEIVELHHDRKRDKPSGTARLTAERIASGGGPADVPIHSVRLRGLLAHQEVLFGNDGEVLTIRHDSLSRESFVAGIVAASKGVMHVRGLAVGLDCVLDEME